MKREQDKLVEEKKNNGELAFAGISDRLAVKEKKELLIQARKEI